MKIRSDFVTNSSSSSFIIGKKDDSITVEIVFNMLKGFYQEYLDIRDKIISKSEELGVFWNAEKNEFESAMGGRSFWDLDNKIEKEYGISLYDGYQDFSWMAFETYKDYESFWMDKIQKDAESHYSEAPFSIIDYSNPDGGQRIDCGKWGLKTHTDDVLGSDVFGWYVACGDSFFERVEGEKVPAVFSKDYNICEYCSMGRRRHTCKTYKKMQSKDINPENAVLMILGKICIHSECGRIPGFVVNKLRDISNYSCNHMG